MEVEFPDTRFRFEAFVVVYVIAVDYIGMKHEAGVAQLAIRP